MTLYRFKHLSWEEMESYVRKAGVLIAKRETERNRFALYQCINFYVEFQFTDDHVITDIKSLTTPPDPYLKSINITEIKKAG